MMRNKIVGGAIASAAFISMFAMAGVALADGTAYDNNPGRLQAVEVGAQCGTGAGSGAFGYFGKDNNMAGGADGTQTGINNSAVCGNRQGNL